MGAGYGVPVGLKNKLNFYGNFGFQYYIAGAETDARAKFAGAPTSVAPMEVGIDMNESHIFGALGIELLTIKDLSVGVEYSTAFDQHSNVNRWDLRARVPF